MEEVEQHRLTSLEHCQRLLNEIRQDQEDAAMLFCGDIYRSYIAAVDKAITKAESIKAKIRNF